MMSLELAAAERITARCDQRLEATLQLLREMVAINSFTENAAGVDRLGQLTADAFAPFGFTAESPSAANPAHGHHLVLQRSVGTTAPTIALISHLDTVFTTEEEERNDFRWRPEGKRIYGPGTNDIKGGTALMHLMLATMAAELPETFAAVNWTLLFNACEEVISADFRKVCRERLPADTLACLVFEADGGTSDNFSLVAARKGRATFSVEVEGRGAHAGSSHRRGANAVVELAEVVSRLSRLTDYDQEVTVNVGSVSGGTVPNRVPHFARAELEMRAFSSDTYARAKAAILDCAGTGSIRSADQDAHACKITVRVQDETVPWPKNLATERLLAFWQSAGGALGMSVQTESRGGLSDGNVLWDLFPTLDGLGPRGDDSHCSEQSADGSKQQEWVDVTSFVPKAVLNIQAISALLRAS